jgi:pimeloyl-ACP methyl ester carboxylesterase/VanZ family protein
MASAAHRWAALAPAASWAVLIFALSSRSDVGPPAAVAGIPFIDKGEHFVEYATFGFLLIFGIRRGPKLPRPLSPDFHAHLAFFIATLYAVTDEVHQAFVPLRQADAADLLFDAFGAFAAAFVFSSLLPPAPPRLTPPDRELRLPHGLVRYMIQGKGPPILYLHGWHGSKRYFAHAATHLPGHQHLAPDMLGFGASEAPGRFSYSPRDQALVVRALARSLGISSAVVVGHSMGGAVALALAVEDPSFVQGLVLVEPAIRLPVPYPFLLVRADLRTIGVGFLRHFIGLRPGPLVHLLVEHEDDFPRQLLDDALSVPLHASARSLARLFRNDLGTRFNDVKAPVLVIFGDHRHPVRAKYARLLVDEVARYQLLHIDATSHCPMVEDPDRFYGAISQFLETGKVSGAEERGAP